MIRKFVIAAVLTAVAGIALAQTNQTGSTTSTLSESFERLYSNPQEAGFYADIVRIAGESAGLRRVPSFNGRSFTTDCIGFVKYVYYKAGLDLAAAYGDGNRGVDSLFNGLAERNLIFTNALPRPGDIIFFDNTYDANRNGRWDDLLTHIGIVESIGSHNTVTYIHYSTSEGITRDQINMEYPATHAFRQSDGNLLVINSPLRRNRGEGFERNRYISSFFFRGYAHIPVRRAD